MKVPLAIPTRGIYIAPPVTLPCRHCRTILIPTPITISSPWLLVHDSNGHHTKLAAVSNSIPRDHYPNFQVFCFLSMHSSGMRWLKSHKKSPLQHLSIWCRHNSSKQTWYLCLLSSPVLSNQICLEQSTNLPPKMPLIPQYSTQISPSKQLLLILYTAK